MLKDVIEVKPLEGYRLFIRFEDGKNGEIDIEKLIPFKGIFAPLKNLKYFSQVSVNSDIGTICWDNGADISPKFLYDSIDNNWSDLSKHNLLENNHSHI